MRKKSGVMTFDLSKKARDFLKLLADWRDSGKLQDSQYREGLLGILKKYEPKLESHDDVALDIPHSPIKVEGRRVTRKGKKVESD